MDDDDLEILDAAWRRLRPWFDTDDELERWATDQLLHAADEMRLLKQPPPGWPDTPKKKGVRESLRFVETVGAPTPATLLFEIVPHGVTLNAAWTRPIEVGLTGHARERMYERMAHLEPDAEQRRLWLNATVDRALRAGTLTLDAPRWAASAPLRPGFGWTTRMLGGDEVALLIAAPHTRNGSWNIVTVLSKSTSISTLGRLVRRFKRGRRLVANRIRHRSPAPVRERAERPPRLGDVSAAPPSRWRNQRGPRRR